MERCRTTSINRFRVLELPLPLIYDILSKLNVETIFSCKCVCKTFLDIITNPYFFELHLKKAPNVDDGLVIQNQLCVSNVLVIYDGKTVLDFENVGSDHGSYDSNSCQTLAMPAIDARNHAVKIVGSCNGMICYCYRNKKTYSSIYYICNPILGEFWALPPHDGPVVVTEVSGFGFCPKAKQYKVIRLSSSLFSTAYTFGTSSSWRVIGKLPFPRYPWSICNCSLTGNLYWITTSHMTSDLICSFNLQTEKYSYLSTPTRFNRDALVNHKYINIGWLGGSLCFSYLLGVRYEAFMKKKDCDDDVKGEHWTKELSIDLTTISMFRDSSAYRVINFLNNGYLVIEYDRKLIACNLRKGTTRYMLAEKTYCCDVLTFVPSFVSLKELAAAAGGHVEVVQRKIRRDLWSENGFRFFYKYPYHQVIRPRMNF